LSSFNIEKAICWKAKFSLKSMSQIIFLLAGVLALAAGAVLGYYARQSIAKKQIGSLEERIQKKIFQAKKEAEAILEEAKRKGRRILEKSKKEEEERRRGLLETEKLLLKREHILDRKVSDFEAKEKEFSQKVEQLRKIKKEIERLQEKAESDLERISKLSKEEAKKELLEAVERRCQQEVLERMRKLESEGMERYEKRAKELLALAIQKTAVSQAQEITTTTVTLPNEDIKGRIIGKEGRNIRTLERLTGVEIVVDETPETVLISAFDPVRRQIAKTALEKLIADGRIQPARIEDMVERATAEINSQIKEAGESAVYDTGIVGLDPKLPFAFYRSGPFGRRFSRRIGGQCPGSQKGRSFARYWEISGPPD